MKLSTRACVLAVIVLPFASERYPQAGQTTFRSTTDVVYVTATVIGADGHLVTDLTEDDFRVRADGVRREMTVFHSDQIPFAASIWFDISPSDVGSFPLMAGAMSEFVRHFGPGDRANVGSFNGLPSMTSRFTANRRTLINWVNASLGGEDVPCFGPTLARSAGRLAGDWDRTGTASWSAIECGIKALASDLETPRHVVVIVTDGFDNVSGIDERYVERLANRDGVMVYVVAVPGTGGVNRADLEALADHTGGGYLPIPGFQDLESAFAEVADELRHQYVIGFSPSTATTDSHEIDVLCGRPNVHVRFRRAYATSDRGTPAPPPDMGAAVVAQPLAIGAPTVELTDPAVLARLDRYLAGDSTMVPRTFHSRSDLRIALDTLRNSAPSWIGAASAPADQSRRRLAVAAYTLDLVAAQPDTLWVPPSLSVSSVLDWTRWVLDMGPPSAAERVWYKAAAGLLERFEPRAIRPPLLHADQRQNPVDLDPPPLLRLVKDGEKRFPGDAWWALERALEQELRSWPDARDGHAPEWVTTAASAIGLYDRAAEFADVRAEAEVRRAFLTLRLARLSDEKTHRAGESLESRLADGDLGEVLRHLDAAGTPVAPELRYLLNLFRGMALQRGGRLAEAVGAFRAAFSEAPYAQSATVALGTALAESGQSGEAAALLSRMWDITPAPVDPWLFYVFPHYPHVDEWRHQLRAALAP
jgi:Ca-activated chloride channel homolog